MARKKINQLEVFSGVLDGTEIFAMQKEVTLGVFQTFQVDLSRIVKDKPDIEVLISSEQLLDLGNTPIELLPNIAANKYYDIEKIIFEYIYNSVAYNFNDAFVIYGVNAYSYLDGTAITSSENTATSVGNYGAENLTFGDLLNVTARQELGKKVMLGVYNNTDPTLGDGSLLVKIWYKVRTFGTEL